MHLQNEVFGKDLDYTDSESKAVVAEIDLKDILIWIPS